MGPSQGASEDPALQLCAHPAQEHSKPEWEPLGGGREGKWCLGLSSYLKNRKEMTY